VIDCICIECKKIFQVYKSRIKDGRGKFCSKKCFYKDFSTRPPWNKGKKLSVSHRLKAIKNLIHTPGENHPRWKTRIERICINCTKKFLIESWKLKEKKAIFCSRKCTSNFLSGINHWAYNKKRPEISEENHYLWAGNEVGYIGLHEWVYRKLGQPDTCEFCGKSGLSGHKIHWANKKPYLYRRNLNDWLRLCAKCHNEYDSKML